MTVDLSTAWWIDNATNPDALFGYADAAIKNQTLAQEKAWAIARQLAEGENKRHQFKLGAIERLMQSANPSGKSYSFTAASDLVGADESYRDYLNHLDSLRHDLDAQRHEVAVAGMQYRLFLEAIRRTNKESA